MEYAALVLKTIAYIIVVIGLYAVFAWGIRKLDVRKEDFKDTDTVG